MKFRLPQRISINSILISFLYILGCGQGSAVNPGANTGSGSQTVVQTPVNKWTISGTIVAPANETSTHAKLVVLKDVLNLTDVGNYLNVPVSLTYSGSPPTANFTVTLDQSLFLGSISTQTGVGLMVFNDENGDGVRQFSEPYISLSTLDPSSGVFCNGTTCDQTPWFFWTLGGTTNTSNGTGVISIPGWYYEQGCNDFTCAHLISTTNSNLTGIKLTYAAPLGP